MSVTPVPQKRRRTDADDHSYPPLNEMTKDKDLWYSDGNIVVGAGPSLFRVHKSVLSRHSVVFDDMFGGPPHQGEEVDGCPFVRLFGDNPAEVRAILNEMYGMGDRRERKVSLVLLCALVRLGEKYDIPAMRTEGAGILRELYDIDLSTFQQRQPSYSGLFGGGPIDPSTRGDFPIMPWKREYCFDIYVLARDHGMKDIAAHALYECCSWPLATLQPETIPILDPDVLWACALGREQLAKRGAAQLLKLEPNNIRVVPATLFGSNTAPSKTICQRADCASALEKNFGAIKEGRTPTRIDPLVISYNDSYINQLKAQLCSSCSQRVLHVLQSDARAIWDLLPEMLTPAMSGLPV